MRPWPNIAYAPWGGPVGRSRASSFVAAGAEPDELRRLAPAPDPDPRKLALQGWIPMLEPDVVQVRKARGGVLMTVLRMLMPLPVVPSGEMNDAMCCTGVRAKQLSAALKRTNSQVGSLVTSH
jgi:hypothetical protein